jgi:hypothetical protein
MKPWSGRISAIATGAIALGALIGAAGEGPASAASYTHLCIDAPNPIGIGCAMSEGLGNFLQVDYPSSSTTNWIHPSVNGGVGSIQQANVNLCIQLDAAAGDLVRGATCNGDQAEAWENYYDASAGRTEFISIWGVENGKGNLCLTWAQSGANYAFVDAESCGSNDLYQQWGSG